MADGMPPTDELPVASQTALRSESVSLLRLLRPNATRGINTRDREERIGQARPFYRTRIFWILLIFPNAVSVLYYWLIASPVYVSNSSLVVFKANHDTPSISTLLSGVSGAGSLEGSYIVRAYIGSWAAYQSINRRFDLARSYERGDVISRYGGLASWFQHSDIALWRYYQGHVHVAVDPNSGIVSTDVEAYTPGFAAKVARQLLNSTIAHIDRMNREEERDYIARAVQRRAAVLAALRRHEAALAAYRAKIGVFDPKSLYLSQLSLLNALAEQRAKLQAQRKAVADATSGSPVARNLEAAITLLNGEIARAGRKVSTLSKQAAIYQPMVVAEHNDIDLLKQVDVAVQEAKLNATKNQYFLAVISAVSQPRTAELPYRLEDIGIVFLVTILLWGILR